MCQRIEFNRRNEAQVLAKRGISNGGGEGERERDGREKEKERNKKTRRERQGRVV
jgi:hypothetical protein